MLQENILKLPNSISYKDEKNNVEISAYPFDDYSSHSNGRL